MNAMTPMNFRNLSPVSCLLHVLVLALLACWPAALHGATGRGGSGGGGLSALPAYALTNNQTTATVFSNQVEVANSLIVYGADSAFFQSVSFAGGLLSYGGPFVTVPFTTYTADTGSPKTNIYINAALGNIFRVLLTNNMGLVITNGTDGQELSIELYQDGTGNRTVTHVPNTGGAQTNNWQFGEDITSPITLTTNQYKKDLLKLRYEVTNLATNTSRSNWVAIGMLRKYPN